jgi:predicted esterase
MDLNLDVNVDNNNNEDLSSHQRLHHHQQQQQQQQRWWRQFEGEEWRAVDGLHATVAHLHELIRKEAALVGGPGNIFLGGISQGCAAGLVALLLWDGEWWGGAI